MMVILLISSIILHFKIPKLPTDQNSDNDKVLLLIFSITALLMIVGGTIILWFPTSEQFAIFLFITVVMTFVRLLYPIIYFMNHPNLKEYVWKTLKQWSQSKLIVALTPDLELWKNVCLIFTYFYTMGGCFGLLFEYKWPKAKTPNNNQVSPA